MESKTTSDARLFVHSKLLALRNLYNIVSSERFDDVYIRADDEQQKLIWRLINENDQIRLSRLLRQILQDSFESLPMKDLRKLAQEYGVQHYQSLPKVSLLSAIKNKEIQDEIDNPTNGNGVSSITI